MDPGMARCTSSSRFGVADISASETAWRSGNAVETSSVDLMALLAPINVRPEAAESDGTLRLRLVPKQ